LIFWRVFDALYSNSDFLAMGQLSVANTHASKESSKLAEGGKKSAAETQRVIQKKKAHGWEGLSCTPLGLKGLQRGGVNHPSRP